jgi:hypothetical protein
MSADTQAIVSRPAVRAGAGNGPPGPLVWQRTDTVGTELVFQSGADVRTATGFAVVAGPLPHTTHFSAELDAGWAVRDLTVTCEGAGWSRTLWLTGGPGGAWTCRTQETGDLGRSLTGAGHPAPAPPGIEDPDRLAGASVVRLNDSPIFLTWALRRMPLTPGDKPVAATTIRVLTPSLVVLPTLSTYQLISGHRLRIGGDEPSVTCELDPAGLVTYQTARLRLAR